MFLKKNDCISQSDIKSVFQIKFKDHIKIPARYIYETSVRIKLALNNVCYTQDHSGHVKVRLYYEYEMMKHIMLMRSLA